MCQSKNTASCSGDCGNCKGKELRARNIDALFMVLKSGGSSSEPEASDRSCGSDHKKEK